VKQYGNLPEAAAYFTDDARSVLKSRGEQTLNGRKEIDEHYGRLMEDTPGGKPFGRYFASTFVVDVQDADHARSRVDVMGIRRFWDLSKGPCLVIAPELFSWEHDYVRTPKGWKFSHQVTNPKSFESPQAQVAQFISHDSGPR
jgi:hypothetical protein